MIMPLPPAGGVWGGPASLRVPLPIPNLSRLREGSKGGNPSRLWEGSKGDPTGAAAPC